MPRLSCSTIVLSPLLSLWMLAGDFSQPIGADEAPAQVAPPFVAKIEALLKDKSARPTEGDDEEKKLLKERCVAAETMVQINLDYYKRGTRPITLLLEAMEQLRKARLELSPKPEEQIAILEAYFELTKYEEQRAEDRYKIGASGKDVVAAARYARLTAQLQLLRAKRQRKSAGSK